MNRRFFFAAVLMAAGLNAAAQDVHPSMESDWWATAGGYFADRELKGSASASHDVIGRVIDLEGALDLDRKTLYMAELGWQFGEDWGVALQYFSSKQDSSLELQESVEWQGNVYDIGAFVSASTGMRITRLFFARRFRENGPHRLRLGAGLHWLDLNAEIAGQASIDGGQGTEFRRSSASASLPVPNIGVWYRYSPNNRWLFNARIDWLSASVDKFSGDIWNIAAGVNLRIWEHVGVGLAYQDFHLGGSLREDNWRGAIETNYAGPYLYVSGFW